VRLSRELTLYRLFFLFPSGSAGLALLGLRLMCGIAAIAVGVAYVDGWSLGWPSRLMGLILLADGLLLSLGLLTRIAGMVAPLLACAVAFQWVLTSSPWFVEIRTVALPFAAISLALVALGPGAYSIDARLFGRKELRIPPQLPPDE
jgi:uncharacterized membrane protein YphA (DoxX/SURF4 family)